MKPQSKDVDDCVSTHLNTAPLRIANVCPESIMVRGSNLAAGEYQFSTLRALITVCGHVLHFFPHAKKKPLGEKLSGF
jgi:hypothetical protein